MNEYTSKGGVARSHSNNGNLQDDGARIFQYDYKNRLVAVWDKASNTPRAAYLYYGDGRRAKTIVFSAQTAGVVERETLFFYDGWQVCEEQSAQGLTETTYVYGHYVDDLVQFVRTTAHPLGAGTFYSHCNARFDVVATTDASGQVVERRFYDDFGRQFGADKQPVAGSAVGNPYGFQGRRLDVESGLYYFRHRYYDPETGRFVQRDPIWDPGNVGNQYSFVGNGPNGATDPLGLSPGFVSSFVRGFTGGFGSFKKGMAALGTLIASAFTTGNKSTSGGKTKIPWETIGDILVGVGTAILGKTIMGTLALDIGYATIKGAIGATAANLAGRDEVCSFAFEFSKGLAGALLGATLTKLVIGLGKLRGGVDDTGSAASKTADDAGGGGKVEADGPGCFLAGTLVETRAGRKRVEDIQIGDEVLARDEATGEQGYKRVVRLFRGQTDQVLYLRIGKAASGQQGRSERHRVGKASTGTEESDEPPTADLGIQTIRSTLGHPYYVEGRGFVHAKDLKAGDQLRGSRGEALVVVGLEVKAEKADHYNFEVEDYHTYFVSETAADPAVWVHNRDCLEEAARKIRLANERRLADIEHATTRANEIRGGLQAAGAHRNVTAVGVAIDEAGRRYTLVASIGDGRRSSVGDLLRPGEIHVPGSSGLHAEQALERFAASRGWRVVAEGATIRHCPKCWIRMGQEGVETASSRRPLSWEYLRNQGIEIPW